MPVAGEKRGGGGGMPYLTPQVLRSLWGNPKGLKGGWSINGQWSPRNEMRL